MKILFVTSEAYPFIKTGGLGDVCGALPVALRKRGIDARLLLPAYPAAMSRARLTGETIPMGNILGVGETRLLGAFEPESGCPVWLVDCPPMFERSGGPYMMYPGQDWPDNFYRFGLLSKVAATIGTAGHLMDWRPDVIHCHDWQTGFVPAYLRAWGVSDPPVVFTIHNLHYMGLFGQDVLKLLGLPESMWNLYGLAHHGLVSALKAGIQYSRIVTTVSPTYAWEICTPLGGLGLDVFLRERGDDIRGILNGIDPVVWNPENDPYIVAPIDPESPEQGKALNKAEVQRSMGLDMDPDRPLFGLISRLVDQKGIDFLLGAVHHLVAQGGSLAVLGAGEPWLEAGLNQAAASYPGKVSIHVGYSEELAHRIEAGADFLLVPSRFEPCGLTQLYALRYGTVPIVRNTGGLADSVVPITHKTGGTGIVFDHALTDALEWAIDQAISLYSDKSRLHDIRKRGMACDFSWDASAKDYIRIYESLVTEPSGT
ncbi:glycogen synthase GlgA [Phaeovibrio sulfidiphilus]|uniref:Glycogen synthase n=1 Tax=Phaeovibrio sulfidiphilus TaxID=1220600 RepID=A0A8J6YHM4_9PROT|nr:glycogen synthase GlgA [Phaeovibrio sulfidiphilus]MBE1236426.1 glycogen synthase GlgA [Phaeovibrio sulfidiphilus]